MFVADGVPILRCVQLIVLSKIEIASSTGRAGIQKADAQGVKVFFVTLASSHKAHLIALFVPFASEVLLDASQAFHLHT